MGNCGAMFWWINRYFKSFLCYDEQMYRKVMFFVFVLATIVASGAVSVSAQSFSPLEMVSNSNLPIAQLPIFTFANELLSVIDRLPISPTESCGRRCQERRLIEKLWDEFLDRISVPGVEVRPPGADLPSVPGGFRAIWPFAGTVIAVFPCPCNAGIAVITLPVYGSAGPYFIPFASLKSFYNPIPGNLIMGGAVPGGFCGSPLLCLPLPVQYTVLPTPMPGVGSSLLPPLVPPTPRAN